MCFLSCRLFDKPKPPSTVVEDAVTVLRIAVEQILKSKSKLPITITFTGDVFRYLFKGKGEINEGWHYFMERDFPAQHFPKGWCYCLDLCGQGAKPFFLIKVRQFISWSPKKYVQDKKAGTVIPAPRAFIERLTIKLVKVAAGDNST